MFLPIPLLKKPYMNFASNNNSQFSASATFPCSVEELYRWHSRPGALERLIPPWENTKVLCRSGGIEPGGQVRMRMHFGPFPYTWQARHIENDANVFFRDIQERGPFQTWIHMHIFKHDAEGATLTDDIAYRLPGQAVFPWAGKVLVEPVLRKTFRYRHATLREDLKLHVVASKRPLRLLISGASGILGSALLPLLTTGGHEVWRLVRRQPNRSQKEIFWDPAKGQLNLAGLPAFDGVIHLAAENVGQRRWTSKKKEQVLNSRILGTQLLAKELAKTHHKPGVFLSASAVGFYGNCQACCIGEETEPGLAFISDVCSQWERAGQVAQDAGIRTVFLRIGVVLTPKGGALSGLLKTAPFGFSRRFGSGKQFVSWISIDDAISSILHALTSESLRGPVNLVAPNPVTNKELLTTLARVTGRPLLAPVPAAIVRFFFGQMGAEVLLEGCHASSAKLAASGYVFRQPTLEGALRRLLGKELEDT